MNSWLAQSVLKIGSALAERVGQGEVGREEVEQGEVGQGEVGGTGGGEWGYRCG